MKEFFKYTLATVLGIVIVQAFAAVLGLIMLVAISVGSQTTPSVEKGSVLRINLTGELCERSTENPFAELMGNDLLASQGLDDLLAAIKVAKENDKIKGIYLEAGVMQADYASLQELRKALLDFKQSKKFIVAYGDNYSQGTYWVASVADKVLLNPSGIVDWHGIAAQPIFYKDLLEKIGVKMQVFKVGTFKSAVEPYILTSMSDANRLQVQAYIDDIWGGVCKDVAEARKVSVDSLNAYANRYARLSQAENYVKMQLVDSLAYIDGVRDRLRVLCDKEKEVKFVSPAELAKLDKPSSAKEKIAVFYAEGDIVDEAAQNPLGGNSSQIVGSEVVKELDKLMNDESVKAVVLRINSGGGSAYASEQMWRAIQLLKAKKPVVVSMSGLAASGGYYMSCGADCIVAEPATLTGSIGIFGMVPDASGLMTEKLGLHFDVVKTNTSADFGAMGRPFNPEEANAMQQYVNNGYALFLKRVADGRGMKVEDVDKIAQGRVWTGNQALGIKLVDKLGTLQDAVQEAAKRAKLKDYALTAAPAKANWMDNLMKQATKDDYMEQKLQSVLGIYYRPLQFVGSLGQRAQIQARIPYEPNLF
ncbi:MAG: signal peptide peptidase SppA [Alloprevotella sp.]